MDHSLLEQLEMYHQTDYYPFHMPGHKRSPKIDYIPAGIDITEIDGFDNLHHAEGVLKLAQERASRLYGAEESFFLVNGSTAGILAAISATVSNGGTILLARNCHKAAYHGAFLRNLKVQYLYPEIVESYSICGGINPLQVAELLDKNPAVEAVFLTSPTYEGMVSNIGEIADIVHRKGRILIVDEAHGAHLGIAGKGFPKSAVSQQADIVIQSLHKTLPSMTQTAILHVQGNRVDRARLRKYLQIYQTSSPSYVFMAGMDSCIRLLETEGEQLFKQYRENLDWFYGQVKDLKYFHVLRPKEVKGLHGVKEMDPSKICIFIEDSMSPDWIKDSRGMRCLSGAWLQDILRMRYHLEMEMTAGNYVLAMTSIMDNREGFVRLIQALRELDEEIDLDIQKEGSKNSSRVSQMLKTGESEVVMTAAEAEEKESALVLLEESCGRISKEYRYVYPPGVPVLVPGERITGEIIALLKYYEAAGLNVLGQEVEQEPGLQVIGVVK